MASTMKAILCTKYGPPDVLQLKEVAIPTPKDNEVRIKIHATTVSTGDCEMRSFKVRPGFWIPIRIVLGIRKPRKKILGQDLAGEIEAVGKKVTQFQKGDQVFACTGFRLGAYAEYQCLPTTLPMASKPVNMSYEEAATVPVWGSHALHFLRKANVRSGQTVLINGAGGCMGTFAVQLAKYFGADVTAVDSTEKLAMLSSIGADHVIDYTQEDFTQSGESYDVIFDVVGKSSYERSLKSLKRNGRYILANPKPSQMVRGLWTSRTSSQKVIFEFASPQTEDLIFLKELIEAGTIKTVIDRRYPLKQIPEAHRYVDTGNKEGHVVITVAKKRQDHRCEEREITNAPRQHNLSVYHKVCK